MDFKLTQDGDLDFSSTDICLTDSIRQKVANRLRWIAGEWRFGPNLGVHYFDKILVKAPDLTAISREIRNEVLAVENVIDVSGLTVSIDAAARAMTCAFTAVTPYENMKMEVVVRA